MVRYWRLLLSKDGIINEYVNETSLNSLFAHYCFFLLDSRRKQENSSPNESLSLNDLNPLHASLLFVIGCLKGEKRSSTCFCHENHVAMLFVQSHTIKHDQSVILLVPYLDCDFFADSLQGYSPWLIIKKKRDDGKKKKKEENEEKKGWTYSRGRSDSLQYDGDDEWGKQSGSVSILWRCRKWKVSNNQQTVDE